MRQLKLEDQRLGDTVNAAKFWPGDRVAAGERHGTVMYLGPAAFAKEGQQVVGLALDVKRTTSANDGKVDGQRYFRCKPGHCLFVDLDDIVPLRPAGDVDTDSKAFFLETELAQLIGCSEAKEAIRSMRDALEVNQRRAAAGGMAERCPHMAVSGPSGSGLTTWGRIAARMAHSVDCTRKGDLVVVSAQPGAGLVSGSRSGSMEALTKAMKDAAGGTLLIDDAHALLAGSGEDTPGRDVLEALARELDRQRGGSSADSVVVVLAGEAGGIASLLRSPLGAALGIAASADGTPCRQYIQLNGFAPGDMLLLLGSMADSRGFHLERGLLDDEAVRSQMEEICRRASKGRGTTRQAANCLEAAIAAQTRRVYACGTLSKDSLTTLEIADFTGGSGVAVAAVGAASPLRQLEAIVGLADVKRFVRSLQAQLLLDDQRKKAGLPALSSGSLHMIFSGNPGTGKTTVARIIAALLAELGLLSSGHLVEADRASLVAGYVGQTAIKVTNLVKEALGGILFVDEAYTLVQGDKDSFGKEALDTLMKLMEDHREEMVVVFAGYSDEMEELLKANPGLRSRFPTIITFANYSAPELMAICQGLLQREQLVLSAAATELVQSALEAVVTKAATGDRRAANGRAVRNLIEQAKRQQALRLGELAACGGQPSVAQLTELVDGDVTFATQLDWLGGS